MNIFAGTPWERPQVCETCGKTTSECRCPPAPANNVARIPPERQTARLAIEKRKNGRFVTVIRGLSSAGNDLPALLARLKNACGAGGTVDGDVLEVQGKQLERLRTILQELGYKVLPKKL